MEVPTEPRPKPDLPLLLLPLLIRVKKEPRPCEPGLFLCCEHRKVGSLRYLNPQTFRFFATYWAFNPASLNHQLKSYHTRCDFFLACRTVNDFRNSSLVNAGLTVCSSNRSGGVIISNASKRLRTMQLEQHLLGLSNPSSCVGLNRFWHRIQIAINYFYSPSFKKWSIRLTARFAICLRSLLPTALFPP